jgi:predicted ATPase/class 3 adenylate cyclase
MLKCAGCGEECPPRFRFCGYCGMPLPSVEALIARPVRKIVTVLFTDLKDSTALGERLDSEALHEVKQRYFDAMASQIRRHGGKIEKYIGDAIMAVFGLPQAHEDDALRAVRAATAMQAALSSLNERLASRYDVVLANRTGINTGEVITTGDPAADQQLATGDVVNIAARLEQAAPAGQVLMGEDTYRLLRDAVEVESIEPLTLKGKSQPVAGFRLLRVHKEHGNERRHDVPLVGRERELAILREAWDTAIAQRRAQLVTVIGDAGAGKSRLILELMEHLDRAAARVVKGRCLPYGDGITFWPLREMVVTAAGIERSDTPEVARERLVECAGDSEVADRLASASGFGTKAFPLHEINWAARKFMQSLAAGGPVLALVDDIHWAEPAFLDLLENLVATVESGAVLVLATARPELLEKRQEWGQGEGFIRLVLQPLGPEAATQFVSKRLGGTGLTVEFVARIVDAAAGNPLYLEQLLSMLIDQGMLRHEDGRWSGAHESEISVPPTIQALLEARLDALAREEREVAEPASVVGLEFARSAVEWLAPPAVRETIDGQLSALARKQFIRPAESKDEQLVYRFHHQLVRDTVYNGLLKRTRANLHAEFVRWADRLNAESDRGREFEAILGYHLEQAFLYLGELGPLDARAVGLGRDGARRLASAGRRAFARGDMVAAANLLQRAAVLLPPADPQRLAFLPETAEALLGLGNYSAARAILNDATAAAEQQSNSRVKAASRLIGLFASMYSGEGSAGAEDQLRLVHRLIPELESENAHAELATAWRLVVLIHGMAGRYAKASEAVVQAVEHARRAGNERLLAKNGLMMSNIALLGPTPVRQAMLECERLIAAGLADRQVECKLMCVLGVLRAMNSELDAARALYRRARAMLRDLGQGVFAASTGIEVACVELHGGDLALAEREVRADYEFLEKTGEAYYLSTMAALLARIVRDQGRDEEALALSLAAEKASAEDDVESQGLWRAVRAPILARAGDFNTAEQLARSAVELTRRTESPVLQAEAMTELACVLILAGKTSAARAAIADAIALHRSKGDVTAQLQCVEWMDQIAVV